MSNKKKHKGAKSAPSPKPAAAPPANEATAPHTASPSGWLTHPAVGMALAALAALVAYHGILANGFVFFDDDKAVLYNPAVLNPGLQTFFSGQNLGMYAPVTWIAYAVGNQISPGEAYGHHLISLAVHALNAALAYWCIFQLFGRPWPALFAAVLFAVHPVQAEAVSWVAGSSTLLFSLFYLAAWSSYIRWSQHGGGFFLVASLLLFLVSVLAKSAAVTLPLLLIATDYFLIKKKERKFWLSKIPYFLISLLFGVNTFLTRAREGHDIDLSSAAYSALDRFWMISQTLLFYPIKLLAPFGFSIAYPFPASGNWDLTYYLAPAVLAGLGWLVWKYWKSRKDLLLALGLYLLPLSVMLPFRTVGSFELRSDRYVYLSSLGVFLLAALLLETQKPVVRAAVLAAAGIALAFLGYQQSQVWTDGVALFRNCVDKTPEAALCQCNLAYNELIRLDFRNAELHYTNTLDLDPAYVEAYNGRGQARFQTQNFQGALADFDKAIQAGLSTPKLFLNRGKCLVITQQFQKAIPDLDQSLALEPNAPEAWFFKGVAHEKLQNPEQAIQDYSAAIQQNPGYVEALVNRGLLHFNQKQYDAAIADYSAALEVRPDLAMALNNRANAYFMAGKLQESLRDLNLAIEKNPGYLRAYETRMLVFQKLGQPDKAAADAQTLDRLRNQ